MFSERQVLFWSGTPLRLERVLIHGDFDWLPQSGDGQVQWADVYSGSINVPIAPWRSVDFHFERECQDYACSHEKGSNDIQFYHFANINFECSLNLQ